jgi:hypothetical protein
MNFFTNGRPYRGHVPVDGADVVAGHVFAHLGEFHAAAFEYARILAGEDLVDQFSGSYFYFSYLL